MKHLVLYLASHNPPSSAYSHHPWNTCICMQCPRCTPGGVGGRPAPGNQELGDAVLFLLRDLNCQSRKAQQHEFQKSRQKEQWGISIRVQGLAQVRQSSGKQESSLLTVEGDEDRQLGTAVVQILVLQGKGMAPILLRPGQGWTWTVLVFRQMGLTPCLGCPGLSPLVGCYGFHTKPCLNTLFLKFFLAS